MLLLIELIWVMIVHFVTIFILLILIVLVLTILLMLFFIIVLFTLPVRVVVRVSLLGDLVDAHVHKLTFAHVFLHLTLCLVVIIIELLPRTRLVLVLRLLFALGTILRVRRSLFVCVAQLREIAAAFVDLEV